MRLLLTATLLAVLSGAAGCGSQTASLKTSPPTVERPDAASPGAASVAAPGIQHYEYVFPDGAMYVYDIDHGFRLVQRVALPGIVGIRGVAVATGTHILYVSHGSDSGPGSSGSLLAYDLVAGRTLWDRHYRHGIDSMAITPDGSRIYMPDGELSRDGVWYVIDARSGSEVGRIDGGIGPHNTVVGVSGRRVYLGGRNTPYLYVASTANNRVIGRIGPLVSGVRPFTINGRETLAYTTATAFLGFQVSSAWSGRVLYTVSFGPRFPYDRHRFAPSAPSHGVSLSPDERQLWVIDGPNSYLHVFDVSGVPGRPPQRIADVKLSDPLTGHESSCSYDCARDGWLQHSRSGCFVFVGDSGDVYSTSTFRLAGFLPALRDTRKMLEIDWRGGTAVSTSSRVGLGYVTGGRRAATRGCG